MEYPALSIENWDRMAEDLRALFQKEMYGRLPATERFDHKEETILDDDETSETVLKTFSSEGGLRIDVLHAKPKRPVRATFVGANFSGNHTVTDLPTVPEPRGWTYPDGDLWPVFRGCHRERWNVSDVVRAGFGLATFCHSDIVPDHPNLAPPFLARIGAGGAVAAWAWGLLSVAESLESSGSAVFVGHSRLGKAALLAGAMGGGGVACIQSGCGGAAPSRTEVGETVGQITKVFPHWFSPAFAGYAGREEELPFDQHALIALCAPKPVLLLNAEDDEWANPAGQEAMAELARPIYASFRAENALQTWRGAGGHSVNQEDWSEILQFARAHF